MKLQFLLGSIVVAGLLASAPNAASHGGFGGGGGFHGGGFAGFHGGGRFAAFFGRDHFFGPGFGFYGLRVPVVGLGLSLLSLPSLLPLPVLRLRCVLWQSVLWQSVLWQSVLWQSVLWQSV